VQAPTTGSDAGQQTFGEIGCLAKEDSEAGLASEDANLYTEACLHWSSDSPCRSGLPFYNMTSNAASPSLCFLFCVSKGLDVFGFAAGASCHCGASRLNRAVWHGRPPRPGLLLRAEDLISPVGEDAAVRCGTRVYRYTGHYAAGGIPDALMEATARDVAYIDSIVLGREFQQEAEEDDGHAASPTAAGGEALLNVQGRPGWLRYCWPEKCGPGGGPWLERQSGLAAGTGARGHWQDYAVVRYYFDPGVDDARKEAFRAAAARWRSKTCVDLVEQQWKPPEPHVRVMVEDRNSCYAWGIGFPGSGSNSVVNLGWCDGLRYVGNMVHEIGHVLGMNHEQRRPDAASEYHGHGPHLLVHWQNVPDAWVTQYRPDASSYIGSVDDGEGDAHAGYAAYDFESIMQYPPNGRFDTVPPEAKSLTGQRRQLSVLDVAQIIDMYQCRPLQRLF